MRQEREAVKKIELNLRSRVILQRRLLCFLVTASCPCLLLLLPPVL